MNKKYLACVGIDKLRYNHYDCKLIRNINEVKGCSLYMVIWLRKPTQDEIDCIVPMLKNGDMIFEPYTENDEI